MKTTNDEIRVKYHNDMNYIRYVKFTQTDFDFFMAICSQVRNKGEREVEISYDDLMDLVQWDRSKGIRKFTRQLEGMSEKLLGLSITNRHYDGFDMVSVFTRFNASEQTKKLTVKVNQDSLYFLNDLRKNFTSIELKEYVELNGKYAKQIYSQIKQRYNLKDHFWQINISDLQKLLVVPETYPPKKLNSKIVFPAVETIRECKGLESLQLTIVKGRERGGPVEAYRFDWGTGKEGETFDDTELPEVIPFE